MLKGLEISDAFEFRMELGTKGFGVTIDEKVTLAWVTLVAHLSICLPPVLLGSGNNGIPI